MYPRPVFLHSKRDWMSFADEVLDLSAKLYSRNALLSDSIIIMIYKMELVKSRNGVKNELLVGVYDRNK